MPSIPATWDGTDCIASSSMEPMHERADARDMDANACIITRT